jgi:DNA-binding XRE family transcriptional regulator
MNFLHRTISLGRNRCHPISSIFSEISPGRIASLRMSARIIVQNVGLVASGVEAFRCHELNKRFLGPTSLYVKSVLIKRKPKKKKRNRNKASDGRRNLVGARIRELRRKAKPKLTQDQLAGKVAALAVGLDRTAIYRIERGVRAVTDLELAALARALRVPISALFTGPKSV